MIENTAGGVALAEKPYERRWAALAVLALSLVVIGMDNTILNVALPTLVRDLGASASELQWMVDAYVLVFAGLLLTTGALGDRFGRKLVLDLGLLVFVAGSVASAWAGSPEVLIATRAAMGVGAAMIMRATLSIITDTFPAAERERAIGVWAGMAGPGRRVRAGRGRLAAGALLVGLGVLGQRARGRRGPARRLGAGAGVEGPARHPAGPDRRAAVDGRAGQPRLRDHRGARQRLDRPRDAVGIWCRRGAVGALRRLGAAHPPPDAADRPVPQPPLQRRRFSAASAAITLVFFALFGTIFVLQQHLQFVLGYDALEAGSRLLPVATLVLAAPLAARLSERVGTKAVVTAGLVVVTTGLWLVSRVDAADGYAPIAWSLAVLGLGIGAAMAPATASVMGSVPLAKAGVGSAMNDTTRQVGGALGVAVLGSVLSSSYRDAIAPALAGLPSQAAAAAHDSLGAALGVAGRLGAAGDTLAQAARGAFVDAMGDVALVAAAAALLGALVTLVLLPARAPQPLPDVDLATAAGTLDRTEQVGEIERLPTNEDLAVDARLRPSATGAGREGEGARFERPGH
jgi:MFS transporter, DHA2 family, multidrug resistance protein